MTFLHAASLAWLGLAVPIVLIYLRRVRTREVNVSTDHFWEQVFQEQMIRSIWWRVCHPVSLSVQLGMLALIVLALAEPVSSRAERPGRRLVLVVDDSASMKAGDGAPTRLAAAQVEALRLISSLRPRDDAALVVAGTQPRVACGLTADRRALGRAVDCIEPTDGPTRVVEAIQLARHLVSGHGNAQVIVLTDGCEDGLIDAARSTDVRLQIVGARTGNVGITRFQARRSLRDLNGYQILIQVGNYSDEQVRCRLEIEKNGVVIDVVPLSIGPGATWHQVLDKVSNEGGRLRARLDHTDALSADNEAWTLLSDFQPLAIAMVPSGESFADLYVEKVLEANPLVRQPPALIEGLEPGPSGGDASIRVYHRRVPARLPPGSALVLNPVTSCDLWDVGEPIPAPIVGSQDRGSPLLAFVQLENARIAEARRLTPKGKAEVLISLITGEPLYVVFDRPEGKVLVLAAALDDPSDLPLRTVFPIVVGNALAWFHGHRGDLRESVATGGVVEMAISQRALALWSPAGQARPLPDGNDRLAVGPLDSCGVWRVAARADEPAVAEIACNLASPRESDLRPPAGLLATSVPRTNGASAVPTWYTLIVVAWASFILEWFFYQRCWIR
jgi:hypothetical protein